MVDKEKLKAMPRVILYCVLMLVIWPVGAYLMWRDEQIEKQLKVLEIVCCFVLWLLLVGWTVGTMHEKTEKASSETVAIESDEETHNRVWVQKQTSSPGTNKQEPVSAGKKLVKIQAEYEGLAEEGTVLDNDNDGIVIMGTYGDGTTEEIPGREYEIKNPVTLEAGKTSTVTIAYNGQECSLKVKCTTPNHRTGENIIGVSSGDIYDIEAKFRADDVRNDVTGNWRISTIAENIQMIDYALSYYESEFRNDDEIHGIVNFTYNTTTKISVMENVLDVTVHEYVPGEEHDADILFSGVQLQEYFVYLDNGDIEKIQ